MERLLLIGGVKASGKAIIRGKLDAPSQAFISPLHELVHEAFLDINERIVWEKSKSEVWDRLFTGIIFFFKPIPQCKDNICQKKYY